MSAFDSEAIGFCLFSCRPVGMFVMCYVIAVLCVACMMGMCEERKGGVTNFATCGRLACTRSLERRTAGCVLFVTCYLLFATCRDLTRRLGEPSGGRHKSLHCPLATNEKTADSRYPVSVCMLLARFGLLPLRPLTRATMSATPVSWDQVTSAGRQWAAAREPREGDLLLTL